MAKATKSQEAKSSKKTTGKDNKAITKSQKAEAKPVRRASNQSKPNFFQKAFSAVRKYFGETIGELRKVHWPTREEALFLTRIVVVVVTIMSLTLGLLDYIYSQMISLILR